MAVQNQPNMDLFEAYFRRADLDHDGRISGNEAVAFFLGSDLPRQVLAQIWVIADSNRTGFLGRQEFYNALKLVTIAQRKQELTPEIVKAALYSSASAGIPPPRINLTPAGSQQPIVRTSSAPPPSGVTTTVSPKVGPSGPHSFASQVTQVSPSARPLSTPQVVASQAIPPQRNNMPVSYPSHASIPAAVNTAVTMEGVNSQGNKAVMPVDQGGLTTPMSGLMSVDRPVPQIPSPSVHPVLSKPNDITVGGKGEQKDSKALTVGGNGHTPDLFRDVFSAYPVQTKLNSVNADSSISSAPAPSTIVRASSESQLTAKPSSYKSSPSPPIQQPTNNQHPIVHNRQFPAHGAALPPGSTVSGGQLQPSWPQMTRLDIQKYSNVFTQVDTDRDGRITGDQARNLFLSWRIPRDVLKQVWDLSDQDNDSMLSLREFCIAIYLMERHREGRPLPPAFPNNIIPDETVFSASSQHGAPQKTTPASRPPRPVPAPQPDDAVQPNRQKPKVPVLEKHLVDQLSTEEQNSLNAKLQEATEAEKKVAELEKEILDAREKIKFYNTNMSELVMLKSRYDGRLNDISQMISVEKLEVDKLAKKYEEKCRQSGDVASRLTIEESTFRDIQEKKMELYRAIAKLDQEGSAEKFQEHASHIHADLEELVKSLNERCKSYGLRAKPTSLVELPFGWQPGIQGTAADWEENWDKFEDEGFTIVKELTSDVQDIIAPPKPKPVLVREKETSDRDAAKFSGGHVKADNVQQNEEKISDDGENAHDEDQKPDVSPKSPAGGNGHDSKSNEFDDSQKTGSFDGSPRAAQSDHGGTESVSSGDKGFDGAGWGRFDNTNAALDFNRVTAKDSDSLFGSDGWNLQPIKTGSSSADSTLLKLAPPNFDSVPSTPMNYSGSSPQADNLFERKSSFFDSVPSTPLYNSGTSPHADNSSLTKSPFFDSVPSTPMYNFSSTPHADNSSLTKSPFFDSVPSTPMYNFSSTPRVDNNSLNKSPFFDSVPSTPMYNFGSSPKKGPFADSVPGTPMYGNPPEDRSFDSFSRFDSFSMQDGNSSFSRFDSFNMHDGGLFASRDSSLSRLDSMKSTKDSEFDHGPSASRDSFARFDSFRSTADSDYNFGVFPSRDNASLTRFDSIRSTSDTGDHSRGFSSFDDADPFGTQDPFKTSAETPRRDSDSWKAF